MMLWPWMCIVWERWNDIHWRHYWLRMLFITCMAFLNSLLGLIEWALYGSKIKQAVVNKRPVFVLGHPRTGTTHLFNLLTLDTLNFTFVSTFQAGFPAAFILLDSIKGVLSGFVSKRRPMDNMSLSLDHPQEDELALNVRSKSNMSKVQLTCFVDPFMWPQPLHASNIHESVQRISSLCPL